MNLSNSCVSVDFLLLISHLSTDQSTFVEYHQKTDDDILCTVSKHRKRSYSWSTSPCTQDVVHCNTRCTSSELAAVKCPCCSTIWNCSFFFFKCWQLACCLLGWPAGRSVVFTTRASLHLAPVNNAACSERRPLGLGYRLVPS